MPNISQRGFTPLLILLIITVAVLFGSTYIQERTSFLPFAKVDDGTNLNAKSLKCTDEPGNGRFLTIDSNGCGEISDIPQRCEEEPEGGFKLRFKAPIRLDDQWITRKDDGLEINEEQMKEKMGKDPRMGSNLSTRVDNIAKVIQPELINCNLFVNYSDETDCDFEPPIFERDGKKMERMLEGETYTLTLKRGVNDWSGTRLARGGVGCRVEMKVAAQDSSFARQEAKGTKVALGEEDDEFALFGKLYSSPLSYSDDEETMAMAERCGLNNDDESDVPLFPISIGENETITSQECQDFMKIQSEYFDQYLEEARQKALETARENNLKYENDTFVVDPDKELSEEEKAEAEKKADELNKKVAEPLKEADNANEECKDMSLEEAARCMKEVQERTQVVVSAAQLEAIANSLKKMEIILAGTEEAAGKCVKADMGITPFLEAQRLKRRDPNEEDRRLLLCAGSEDPGQLKWRVLVGGMKTGETRTIINEDGTEIISTNSEGTDDGDECGEKDCGADAERIWGLHGRSADATGAPTYPYTVESGTEGKLRKNSFKIYDPNSEDGIEKTIGAYLKSARSNQGTLRTGTPQKTDDQTDQTPLGLLNPEDQDNSELMMKAPSQYLSDIGFEIPIRDVDVGKDSIGADSDGPGAIRFKRDYPKSAEEITITFKGGSEPVTTSRFEVVYLTCGQSGVNPLLCLSVWAYESHAGAVKNQNTYEFGMINSDQDFESQLYAFIEQYKDVYYKGRTPTLPECDSIETIKHFFTCHCGPNSDTRTKSGALVRYMCDVATVSSKEVHDNRSYVGGIHNIYSTLLYPEDNVTVIGKINEPWKCWYDNRSNVTRMNACTR